MNATQPAERLAQRRELLLAQSQAQRALLAQHAAGLRAELSAEALLARGTAAVLGSARARSLAPRLLGAVLLGWKAWRLFRSLRAG